VIATQTRLTIKESKEVLRTCTAQLEASSMGYIVLFNKDKNTWELFAPGGIHLETYLTKKEADEGAAKRERFLKRALNRFTR
jgi:hypothetical protein